MNILKKQLLNNSHTKLLVHPTGADSSSVFFDNSTGPSIKSPIFGNGIGYFNGSSYLSLADSTDWSNICGSVSWTMEGWFYFNSLSSIQVLFGRYSSASPYTGFRFYVNTTGTIGHANQSTIIFTSNLTVSINKWTHIAIVCNGTSINVYINGVADSINSTTMLTNYAAPLYICNGNDNANKVTGFATEIRISNVARYSSNFTPSTSPFTSDSSTKLLIHFNNVGNTPAVDTTGKTLTFSSTSLVPTSIASSNFINSALYFNGSSYLTIPDSTDFTLGSGDFTIHCWVYFNVLNNPTYFASQTNNSTNRSFAWRYYANNMEFYVTTDGTTWQTTLDFSWTPTISTWYHIAITRSSGVVKAFVNGSQIGVSQSYSYTFYDSSYPFMLGFHLGADYYLNGYISYFHVVKGTALWTSTFTPPVSSDSIYSNSNTVLLIKGDGAQYSPCVVDSSSTPKAITNTSVTQVRGNPITVAGNTCIKTQNLKHPYAKSAIFFNGNSYLSIPDSNDFNLGTSDFVIETFIFISSATAQGICVHSGSGDGYKAWSLNTTTSKTIQFLGYDSVGAGVFAYYGSVALTLNAWNHVVLARSGTTLRGYVNGILDTSVTCASNAVNNPAQPFLIGVYAAGTSYSHYLNGYLLDFRLSIGTDRGYTGSTISIPTSYLTADSYTKLLVSGNEFQEYLATEHTGKSLTLGSTLTLKSFQKHPYASIAGYFDGTGDYLSTPYTSDFTLASGDDFTIDFWMYPLSNSLGYIFNTALQPLNYTAIAIQFSTVLSFTIGNSAGSSSFTFSSASGVISLNNWHYIGIKRSSGTTTLWSDGVQIATSSTSYSSTGNGNVYISNQNTNFFQGYLADFRFSKGIARDLSVIPTSPLVSDSYTKLLLPMSTSGTTFTDTTGKSITTYGDAKQITCQPGNIDRTLYFDGTSTGIITVPTSSDFDFGSNDFTIEWWEKLTSAAGGGFASRDSTSYNPWMVMYNGNTNPTLFYSSSNGTSWDIASAQSLGLPKLNSWSHCAITRNGTTFKTFRDGILISSWTSSSSILSSTGTLQIGKIQSGATYLSGNIAWIHIVNGTALYTSSFIAPQNPVVNSNTKLLVYPGKSSTFFKDFSSSWNPKIITSSGSTKTYSLPANKSSSYFDGVGDYLTIPDSTDFNFGTKDFTIHFWVQFISLGTNSQVIYMRRYDANNMVQIATVNKNDLYLSLDGGSGNYIYYTIDSNFIAASNWYHIAWNKNNTGHYIFINGIRYYATPTSSGTPNITMSASSYIGSSYAGTSNFNGYIKDFTVVKGQALWTKNFNPPTRGI